MVGGRYFRIVYTNGTSAQTFFSCVTTLFNTDLQPVIATGDASSNVAAQCSQSRALINALGSDQKYKGQSRDWASARLYWGRRLYKALASTPTIQLSFTYGINSEQTTVSVAGSGTVTYSQGAAIITNGTTANSRAVFTTEKNVRCCAGNTIMLIIGAAFSAPVSGITQLIGGGSGVNGVYWGYNGLQFGVASQYNNTLSFVNQSAFNVDKLDGTGPSLITLNPLMACQYLIMYDLSGFGCATFYLLAPTMSNIFEPVCAHKMYFNNRAVELGLLNPQFPYLAAVHGSGVAGAMATIRVSDFTALLDGQKGASLITRTAEGQRSVITSNAIPAVYTPILTLLNKDTYNGVTNTGSIICRHLSISCSDSSVNTYAALYKNATITNTAYTDLSTSNSMVATSTSMLSNLTETSGTVVYKTTISKQNANIDLTDHEVFLTPGETLCIACKVATNTTSLISLTISFSEWH
jgi:hypothetical protein